MAGISSCMIDLAEPPLAGPPAHRTGVTNGDVISVDVAYNAMTAAMRIVHGSRQYICDV